MEPPELNWGFLPTSGTQVGVHTATPDLKHGYLLKLQTSSWVLTPPVKGVYSATPDLKPREGSLVAPELKQGYILHLLTSSGGTYSTSGPHGGGTYCNSRPQTWVLTATLDLKWGYLLHFQTPSGGIYCN
ncbi:hypothetical protein O181_025124 [Austropuccinia psidii MF-1]|uniref:Uncharacterized protein n=1 Tax=Austropuccinia psidii MF-1 TaxID=1389203 RepID=A0A9Q3H0B8_9BASI|nr:hypothetical protein [Austropuccinia psidii MF-1]